MSLPNSRESREDMIICTGCGNEFESPESPSLDVDPLCNDCDNRADSIARRINGKPAIPNGRYTFHLQGERFTVRVSCPTRKRWTKLEIWVVDKWFEITNPDNKKVILAKLRDPNTDLGAASREYSKRYCKCGICGNVLRYGEEVGACWEKTFGKDRVNG